MRNGKAFACFLGLWALALILPIGINAQSSTTILAGRVLDTNSVAIQGASVTLQRMDSYVERVTTDETGRFRFDALTEGEYRLVIKRSGFNKFEKVIAVSRKPTNTDVEVVLQPQTIAESVVITSSHLLTSAEVAERIAGNR